MGIIVSCARSSSNSARRIRVIQLGGLVQEFDEPVKVKDLTAQYPRHFVCSRRSLHAVNPCPLPAEEELQLGELYFLLPFAALEGELSPANLVSLASKLIASAKKADAAKSPSKCTGSYNTQCQNAVTGNGNCPQLEIAYRQCLLSRSKTWRPCLNTIDEGCCAY